MTDITETSQTVAAGRVRTIPYTAAQLAESAAAFAERITPAKARWAYCADRSSHVPQNQKYGSGPILNLRTLPVCGRLLGVDATSVRFRLGHILRDGIDGAWRWADERDKKSYRTGWNPTFWVGTLEPWHIGHLYFARVRSHPHIVKIGFSRRLHDRFEDISSKAKVRLFMEPGEVRAGTLADEHWWHKNWSSYRISGEWFFDPFMADRSLPAFLAPVTQSEAA